MAVSGPTNQSPSTGPGLLTEDEFYERHLDTYDGLETYSNGQSKEVQAEISEEHLMSAFKNYQDYVTWYGARWSVMPSNVDRFSSPDRYTNVIRSAAAQSTAASQAPQQALNNLKGFLGQNLLAGINAIEKSFLENVTIGKNTVSGMNYQMMMIFVAGMSSGAMSGAYKAIEKTINTFANPLQGSTQQQVSNVVHTFDDYFKKTLGENYYANNPMWLQLRGEGAQQNPDFSVAVQEFVDGFVGDDNSEVHGLLNTAMNTPVFDELSAQTTELVANMREQFQTVANANDIQSAGKIIETIAGGNQKTRDLLYGKLGVTAKQVDDATALIRMNPRRLDNAREPEILEPPRPDGMSEATWLIVKDLAKSKFFADKEAFWSQIALMPIAFGTGIAASLVGGPALGIVVGIGIAGYSGYRDFSASKDALERGTAYNAATHVTGVPLESDEHVAILDEDLNASTAAGLIGVASCFLIPPGAEGFFAAGMSGAVGAFTQWIGDSRQNSADHVARTQKYQFYNPETGEYDMTAEQAQQIEHEAPLQVLKGMAFTVTVGAVMGLAGEKVGRVLGSAPSEVVGGEPSIEGMLRVDAAPSEDGLTHGTLKMPDGEEIPVTLKPGDTPDTVVLQKPDGTIMTATQNNNEAPVAILGDTPQEAAPLHANSAPANNDHGFREVSFSDLPPERQAQLRDMDATYQHTGDEESLIVMDDGNEYRVPGTGDEALSTVHDSDSETGIKHSRIAAHTQRDTIVPSPEDCRTFLGQAKAQPGEEFVTHITAGSKTPGGDPELLEVRIKYDSATDSFEVKTRATQDSTQELAQVDRAFEKAQKDFGKLTPAEQGDARLGRVAMPGSNEHSATFNEALKAIQDTGFDLDGIPKLTSTSGEFAALTSVERYELFCMGLDNPDVPPKTMSETAWKYALTPEQSYEAALKLAHRPDNGLMELTGFSLDNTPRLASEKYGFGITDPNQQIEILKLCVETDPATVKKNLGKIKSESTTSAIEDILYSDAAKAAKEPEPTVQGDSPTSDDQPTEAMATNKGEATLQKFSSREELLEHLRANDFELNENLINLSPDISVQDRVAIAKEAFDVNPKGAIDHIENFQLPAKELLPFANGLVETDPYRALDLLTNYGGVENPTEAYTELAGKLLNKLGVDELPRILRQIPVNQSPSLSKWTSLVQEYAALHPLETLAHIGDLNAPGYYSPELTCRTLETIAKTNPIEVTQQIRDMNLSKPELRKRVAMAAVKADPTAIHYLDNFQLPPQMESEVRAMIPGP